jgi:hypothetical protein
MVPGFGSGSGTFVATGVIDIGSGVQSYSTNDIGNDSYALDGKSLSLADAGAVYTIDELDADDAEIMDDNEDRTDNSSGDFDSSDSISADEDYDLAIQAIGSLTHAGTDSATSYSDDLEYSGSGGSDWQYDHVEDSQDNSGSGGGSYESDVDIDGTDSSDGDSGQDISVTFGSDSSSDSFATATETGNSVDNPYSINLDNDGTVADSTTGMSMDEDGEFDDSATRIELANEDSNEAGSEADNPTDWTSEADFVQDFTLFVMDDNDGITSSGSGNDGTETGSGVDVDDVGGPILTQSPSGVPPGTSDLLETLDQRLTVTLPTMPFGGAGLAFDQAELPSLSLDFEPDTSEMKGDELPEVETSQFTNVQGTGTFDNVFRGAPPTATAMLIALAVAGRDPADITIPTNGSRAATNGSGSGGGAEGSTGSGSSSGSSGLSSGESGSIGPGSGGSSRTSRTDRSGSGSEDALVARSGGARPSGVMVSQGVVSLPGRASSGNGTAASTSTSGAGLDSSAQSAAANAPNGAEPPADPPPAQGSNLTPQPGGYAGGWKNPLNWARGLYTGDPNAPDEYYDTLLEPAGAEYNERKGAAHGVLSAAAGVPGVGVLPAGVNAVLYEAEGEHGKAALATGEGVAAGMFGWFGRAQKAKQVAEKAKQLADAERAAAETAKVEAEETLTAAREAGQVGQVSKDVAAAQGATGASEVVASKTLVPSAGRPVV